MTLFVRAAILVFVVLAYASSASAAAETFAQAATATPTPTTGAAPTPIPCVVPPFGIQLVLENPSPGDTLMSGTQVVMNGVAYDTGSTTGPGIASVTIYLGDRDQGGIALGTAQLGQPNPLVAAGSQFANAGFTLRTPPLPNGNGGRTIFVYARSIVGNAEASIQVPIFLNTAPTPVRGQVPTPVLPTPAPCTPTPTPTAIPTATATPLPAAPTPTATPSATPPPIGVPGPLPPAPIPAAPAAPAANPAPAAAPPAAAPAPIAVAPATATAAPNGGGMPSEVGLLVIGAGAAILAVGVVLRRRERRP